MIFKDRAHAVQQLLPSLEKYRGRHDVVITTPPGGVSIGYYLAENLRFPLQIILTRKIFHPSNEDLAIGTVSLNHQLINPQHSVPDAYLNKEVARIRAELKEEYRKFMGDQKLIGLENKTVILTDDGIATGNMVLSAIKLIRMMGPQKIIAAIPVAPLKTIKLINPHVDDMICLYSPDDHFEPEAFYEDFSELSENNIIHLIREANRLGSLVNMS
jgi:putative phosphoribosyl transferase